MTPRDPSSTPVPAPGDRAFHGSLGILAVGYAALIAALVAASVAFAGMSGFAWLEHPEPWLRDAVVRTVLTATASTVIALCLAVATAYLLSRTRIPGRSVVDALVEIPFVLPPIVVGLALLILFHEVEIAGRSLDRWIAALLGAGSGAGAATGGISFRVPGVIVAQVTVVTAFAVRMVRATFDQIDRRPEDVALTLGASRAAAFWDVLLPQAWRGIAAAASVAWARAMGEFGPILVFAGAMRGRTEVLSTSIYLELNAGRLDRAVSVSILMIGLALVVLVLARVASAGRRERRGAGAVPPTPPPA